MDWRFSILLFPLACYKIWGCRVLGISGKIKLTWSWNQTQIHLEGIQQKQCQNQSAHGSPNGRKSRFEPGSAIWRREVPTQEKNDRVLRREQVITHASRPEVPANCIYRTFPSFQYFQHLSICSCSFHMFNLVRHMSPCSLTKQNN